MQLRPDYKKSGAFDPADFNETGLIPGWDYAPTMPNAFASPVLLLFYFLPEVRNAVLGAQYNEKLFSAKAYERALAPELGFVFHQIESLSRYGLIYPARAHDNNERARVGAWMPSNFLTALSNMPEAEQLQILDGSPAAVERPRRPEAFYRFLAYHLDKELCKASESKLMDSLNGIDFVSVNQFITGSGTSSQSTTRALTLDLAYEALSRERKGSIRFGEVLQQALCRETRLRAWNQKSKAYETIVQRKIATSLPQLLTISCSCAGRKEEDGLWAWRVDDGGVPWLPEIIEVELEDNGNVIVKELISMDEGDAESWRTCKGKTSLPEAISKMVSGASNGKRFRYRLDAVLSFVRDDSDECQDEEHSGHHVLHVRVPPDCRKRLMKRQQEEAARMAMRKPDSTKLVLTSATEPDVFKKRSDNMGNRLSAIRDDERDEWVLFNGFVVSNTVVEDARAFHVSFKEPCLIVFRLIESDSLLQRIVAEENTDQLRIPVQVMNARSLSSNTRKDLAAFDADRIADGKLIAFDAEFVSVQEEEAALRENGSKVVLRETRHALARISAIDCDDKTTILDDHVLPGERVVDYLTRFSGIVPQDLDPGSTTHNLISTRSAYLKLRFLMERGCIFVGHGLRQDFAMVNLVVPPYQIIDTVEIFHQSSMRYISLRWLSFQVNGNTGLQQEIHDSVEDALATLELYKKAIEWKVSGVFEQRLRDLYALGQKTEWKMGADDVKQQNA